MNLRIPLFSLGLISIASVAHAQQQGVPGIGGAPNPIIDALRRGQQPPPAAPSPAAVQTRGGMVVVTISAQMKSPVPASKIYCTVVIGPVNASGPDAVSHKLVSTAATVSGSSFTCTVKLPYQWNIDPTNAQLSFRANVGAADLSIPYGLLNLWINGAINEQNIAIDPIPFPAGGATTTKSVSIIY